MGGIRLRTRGRASAACVAAFAYLFLLTAFLSGFAQGAMATAGADPWQVICSGGSVQAGDTGPATDDTGRPGVTCPLCALSRVATTAMVPVDAAPAIGARLAPVRHVRPQPFETVATSLLRIRTADPRAPPLLS